MKTETKTQELVRTSEDLAMVDPPAKVELPKLSPKQRKAGEKPLSVLSKLASGISEIRLRQPAPKKPRAPRAPRIHRRPKRSFD
jgi:hypothetical protein